MDITTFIGPFDGYRIYIKLIGNKTFGNFMEYTDKRNIYRKELADPKSSEVHVNTKIKSVRLSNMPKNPGDVFYGKIILETSPFYLDDTNFKTGFIHKRYFISYLFTCKLNEKQKKWR